MPGFQPFNGVRYTPARIDDLVAPPYDVISPDDRAALVNRSEHNAVRIELPAEEEGRDRYEVAASLWESWRNEGVLATDPEPSFYAYRMDFTDDDGTPRQTLGVLGALELSKPGEAGILPHERTTTKDKADRLTIIRSCRANLSPIWGLSLAAGLSDLCRVDAEPDQTAVDEDGNTHSLWRITDPAVVDAISASVASAPVVIADGHHRYEVGLAYKEEADDAGADHILCYVVELTEDQLAVGPIHRLLTDLPEGFDLAPWFDMAPVDSPPRGSMALITAEGVWRLTPKQSTIDAADADLDSCRLDVALASFPGVGVRFQHGVERVTEAVQKGEAAAAVLLRPATVEQIADTGRGGERMPPKTTFFFPKLRTGMVFRSVAG